MGIALDKAELLGTVLEVVLYGFSLLIFGGTIWQLLFQRSTRQANRILLSIAHLLLMFSTVHLILNIIRIMDALILYRNDPGGPVAFLADTTQWTFVSRNYVYVLQTLLGDLVILYRCYMVWKSKYVMIVPVTLWCAAGVTGFGAAVAASQNSTFGETLTRWVEAYYPMTFSTNLLATLLLTWRVWYVDQRVPRLRVLQKSPLQPLLHILIDSGLVYTLTLVVGWICLLSRSNAHFTVQSMMVPIISIAFYTMIICIGLVYRTDIPEDGIPLRRAVTPASGI